MTKVLVINGPNLNLLGQREPQIYGKSTLANLEGNIKQYAKDIGVEVSLVQTNVEGNIINYLHDAMGKYDGVILNAGAYSHYSIAIHDAILAINVPVVEVHLSNIYKREEFRKTSVISSACVGQISGFGQKSYMLALQYFKEGGKLYDK